MIRYGVKTDMKICSDRKPVSLLFFRGVHADSSSSVLNGLYLRLEYLVGVMTWHSFRILRSIPRNPYLKLQISKCNAWFFFLRRQGNKIEMCFLVGN